LDHRLRLEDRTSDFYKILFPSWRRISFKPDTGYSTNNVIKRDLIIYGDQGTGKTLTSIRIVEEACKLYGSDKVNAVDCSGKKGIYVFEYGLTDQPVQILVFDDYTLVDVPKEKIRDFFRARNIWFKKKGVTNGLMIKIFCTHRFHGLLPEFRTNLDLLVVKSYPVNPYDRSVMKKFIGEEGMEDLITIEKGRSLNPYWNSLAVFTSKFLTGIVTLPIASVNYLKDLEIPPLLKILIS